MGNEASVPEDEGLQPPSQIPPNGELSESIRVGKALKVAKAVLQKATDASVFRDSAGESVHPSQEHSKQIYEDTTACIPVMYTAEGGAGFKQVPNAATPGAAAQAAISIRTGGKVVRNGGRALINSMRNLAVGSGAPKSDKSSSAERVVPPAPNSGGLFKAENAWETNWDDDDDDEDDSDDSTEEEVVILPEKPPALPDQPSDLVSMPLPMIPMLTKGLSNEWENGFPLQSKPPPYEKPSVQMFLPLLRVLGKGSFGKVRC